MEEEIWKQIKYNPNYEVSNMGNIRNTKKGVIMKGSLTIEGHKRVSIYGKQHYIYRLVCVAFLENPDNLHHIYHIDNDRTNNKLSNLCWKK